MCANNKFTHKLVFFNKKNEFNYDYHQKMNFIVYSMFFIFSPTW